MLRESGSHEAKFTHPVRRRESAPECLTALHAVPPSRSISSGSASLIFESALDNLSPWRDNHRASLAS